MLIADSGSSDHFATLNMPVVNKRPTTCPITIQLPNGNQVVSTHQAELDLPMLSPLARHVHIVPGLQEFSLLSIGQLCDAGYSICFDKNVMRVLSSDDTCVLTGTRSSLTRLWHICPPTSPSATHIAASATTNRQNKTGAELVAFAHATLFSPAISTLQLALDKGYLINFPGLKESTLRRFPPQSIPMIKGHLDQSRKNQRSTAPTLRPPDLPTNATDPLVNDLCPTGNASRTHACYAATIAPTGQIYSDQTGRFVIPSSTGNNYIMIIYDYDSNFIFAQPYKNRTAKCLLDAYKILHARLCNAGLKPRLQRLDNECSQMLKEFMDKEAIDYQLVPQQFIDAMRQNALSVPSRIILLLDCAVLTKTSPSTYGTNSFRKLKSA